MCALKNLNTKVVRGDEILGWCQKIMEKRYAVGDSVATFKYAKCRVRQLKGPNSFPPLDETFEETTCTAINKSSNKLGVLYWIVRDQRVQDNWAFLFAQRLALKFKVPLHVCFCIVPHIQTATLRHFNFMVDGLKEIEEECKELCIPFHLVSVSQHNSSASSSLSKVGQKRKWDEISATDEINKNCVNFYETEVAQTIINLIETLNIGCILTDFCPLRQQLCWSKKLAELLPEHIPFCQVIEVDAHNVVPTWYASDKLEYAARTIRPKLHQKASELFTEFPPLIKHPYSSKHLNQTVNWDEIRSQFRGDTEIKLNDWAKPGTKSGLAMLFKFIHEKLKYYADQRNDPTKNCLSDLSPWFHFGQIAPQRALLEVKALKDKYSKSADAFIEEAFIRRELSDNFCYYNPFYDSIRGASKWAQETLSVHAQDKRNPSYTEEEMINAKTKDDLWNASQRQLLRTGKIHGFLRMYWAKKILEWHADGPEAALKLALYLNDHYALDGSDPNGYVGVMWSICGVHDQGWSERPVFGKIRCMTYKGCQGKFSVPIFVSRYPK